MQARLRQAGIGLALLVILTGCDHVGQRLRELTAPTTTTPTTSRTTRPAPVATRKVPKPAPRPAAEPAAAAQPVAAVPASPETDVERAATIQGDRELPELAVVGLTEAQLKSRLGQPSADEPHPPGRVWRYRGDGCTVSLSLYPDVRTKVFRTLAYEVISDDNSAERKHDCLEGFGATLAAGSGGRNDRGDGGGTAGGSGATGDGR